ncbi:MAG: exosortase A [Pseudomonadota bacterium]
MTVPTATNVWLRNIAVLAFIWLALALVLSPTFQNMEAIWGGSTDTYSYGYVILPATLWLLWRLREHLARIPLAPDWRTLALAVPMGLIWLLARLSGAQVVEQYALVSIFILAVPACFGWAWFKAALFPFLFLLMMVPNGDFLLPYLIEYTADFTTVFVRMVGVPLYREGPYLTLPTGHWAVVEACGGLRYLTASITLGLLYAYLTYRTTWKRLAFALAAVLVPLLANGLRAVMVVLTGHYSDMTLMIGEDHILFGWVWFGLVMMLTFWVGGKWREDLEPEAKPEGAVLASRLPVLPVLALVAGMALFPYWEGVMQDRPGQERALAAPEGKGEWQRAIEPAFDWAPKWENPDADLTAHYRQPAGDVLLYLAYYGRQRQGAELISHNNQVHRALRGGWEFIGKASRPVTVGERSWHVVEARVRNPKTGQRLLVWQWNQVDGQEMSSLYFTKLRLASNLLMGSPDAGTAIVLATPLNDQKKGAEERLAAFLAAYGAEIRQGLDPAH